MFYSQIYIPLISHSSKINNILRISIILIKYSIFQRMTILIIIYIVKILFLGLLIYYLYGIKNKSLIENILYISTIIIMITGYIVIMFQL